jgi:hypothetical protein
MRENVVRIINLLVSVGCWIYLASYGVNLTRNIPAATIYADAWLFF